MSPKEKVTEAERQARRQAERSRIEGEIEKAKSRLVKEPGNLELVRIYEVMQEILKLQ